MPTNKLTDAQCRGLRAIDGAVKLFDGGGLYLHAMASGGKVWRVAYRLAGKPKTLTIGPYPEISLAAARERLAEARALLRRGEDPMAARPRQTGITFHEASETYWARRADLSESYRANALRGLAFHLAETLGEMPIGAIGRADLMAALQRLDAAGKHCRIPDDSILADEGRVAGGKHATCSWHPEGVLLLSAAWGRSSL
jgi:hypothetical protein